MNTTNTQVKRKNICDKDIQDFFFFVEEKFENAQDKLDKFVDAVQDFNSQNDEETLQKLKELFSSCPILILELNKLLPKSNRLALLEQENADNFLQKIRTRDEGTFKEVMKAILALKNGEMTQEKITIKFEELLTRYPDLLEEAYLFVDYKKINSANFKKALSAKMPLTTRPDLRKPVNASNEKNIIKYLENAPIAPKIQTSPDLFFFSSLKEIFTPLTYKVIIKLLHLYNEGVLSHYEFIELVQPYFVRQINLFEYLKTLTYSKMMNRRQFAIFNRPICELDLSKSLRVASYYDLPKDFPYRISSGRNEFESSILNDRLVTIPTGSEDDKNPMKKNHYEENLFKFEDQRYEIDMVLEIFHFTIDGLESMNQKVADIEDNPITEDFLNLYLGKSNIKFILRFYRDFGQKIIQGMLQSPKKTLPIVINHFKKRIEELSNQKAEIEKTIKVSFDRFYNKSFDYRSFKFKNFDKKNNNAKAFLKEIINRRKDKQTTSNVNVLKGGTDNSEFFTSLNFKFHKDNVIKQTNQTSSSILLNDIDLDSMRKQLPELKIIFDNLNILSLTIALIYYQLYSMTNIDLDKICEYFNPLILNLFGMNLSNMIENLKTNALFTNDKNLNYSEIIDSIKSKAHIDDKDYAKYYNLDSLAKTIVPINDSSSGGNGNNQDKPNTEENISMSPISLTPSLQSQDTGKTFKDIITFNSSQSNKNDEINTLFYPMCEDNILFYTNENCFIFIRYIFCIYERLNKLNEYNSSNANSNNFNSNNNNNSNNQSQESNATPAEFKNFIIIYKALLHKKIENTTMYEELCRDILGNESYFLFNVDKLINSLSKTMTTIINDHLSKEVINLFKFEINRKTSPNEKLYFANYLQLLDNNSGNNFRILINRNLWIMCIHLMELPIEPNKKDYYDQFKDFVNKTLQASYISMYQDNQSEDDPFNIFLNRNKEKVTKTRECLRPLLCSNNLVFRFDYATKKLQYLKSGCDVLIHRKQIRSKAERAKKIIEKNFAFNIWNEGKLASLH